MAQCTDLVGDRATGNYWERQFCKMAATFSKSFTAQQIGRTNSACAYYRDKSRYLHKTLPDVTIWTRPGEHHEIKHKDPTVSGEFGLEYYRINALYWFARETGQDVFYTIHNYGFVLADTRQERKAETENDISHWLTASIMDLVYREHRIDKNGVSWVNGQRTEGIEIWYWNSNLFFPLQDLWAQENVLANPRARVR